MLIGITVVRCGDDFVVCTGICWWDEDALLRRVPCLWTIGEWRVWAFLESGVSLKRGEILLCFVFLQLGPASDVV